MEKEESALLPFNRAKQGLNAPSIKWRGTKGFEPGYNNYLPAKQNSKSEQRKKA